ncbi:MAG: hypothetical protein AAGC53_04215 [Actinomycetota bacterium]
MTAATISEPVVTRHPIRGFFYGVLLGIGSVLIVVGEGIAALGTWPPFLVLLGGIVFGLAWSTFGPAKAPKGPPPVAAEVIEEPPIESEEEPTPGS